MDEELPEYLSRVLDKAECILDCSHSDNLDSLEMHEVVLDRTVSFLREVSQMDVDDKQDWISLSQAF